MYNIQFDRWSLDKISYWVEKCIEQKYKQIMFNNQALILRV